MARRAPGRSALVLAGLAAAVVAASALVSPGRAPEPGRETTLWLAVESRAFDGDLVDSRADRARFRARFGREAERVALERGEVEGQRSYDAPRLWTALAAAARRLGGPSGPFLLQGALFAVALLAGAATVRPRLGPVGAALLAGVALLGSAALASALHLEPHALEMAATSVAAAAAWRRGFGRAAPAEDVYAGEPTGTPGLARWIVAGAGAGVLVGGSAAYLPLVLPLLLAVPERGRRARVVVFLAAAAGSLAGIVALGGAPWPPVDFVVSPRLWAWSAAGLLAGRGVGLLPFYLPAALLVTSTGRDEGRSWVVPAVALAALSQLLIAPFDFVESSGAGNAWFLAPLALLLAAASHAESRGWTVAIALAGAPFVLAPVVLAPLGLSAPAAAVERLAAPLVRLLPEPTTLRAAPGAADLVRPGLVVRGIEPGIHGGASRLRLASRAGRLVAISERPLSSIRLELGGEAPVATEVRGGKLGNTTIRPTGELALDVGLDPRRARRHPVWWSREDAWIHALELVLPGAPAKPIAVEVPFGRPVVPVGGEIRGEPPRGVR